MALHLLHETEHYQLGIWKMDESEAELFRLAGLDALPTHSSPVRRQEFLAVRALAVHMGLRASDIDYLPSGKPILKGNANTISISHTKHYVAVLLSPNSAVGVDVEQTTDRVRRIRNKFMHPEEEATLTRACTTSNETTGLLLHWCAKEAMFKAVPEEGVEFAKELRICGFDTPEKTGTFKGEFTRTGKVFQIDYLVETDFVLTCSFSIESR